MDREICIGYVRDGFKQCYTEWYCKRHSDAVYIILSRTMSGRSLAHLHGQNSDRPVLTCTSCHVRVTAEGMADIAQYRLASAVPRILSKLEELGRIGHFGFALLSQSRHCYS